MALKELLLVMAVVAATAPITFSADADSLQDICVADLASTVKVNGFPCKENVTAEDFFSSNASKPAAVNTPMGSVVTPITVKHIPGLNTLGISMSRIDFAPGGASPPHFHPRATEMVFVLEGEVEAGFITTSNALISKVIKKGEIFVLPKALLHYQRNNGNAPASVITTFTSQLPGTVPLGLALFTANPPISDNVIAKGFHVEDKDVQNMKAKFATK